MSENAKNNEFVSLMDKVMDLIRVPTNADTRGVSLRPERASRRYYKQPGRGHNHDLCDSCQEGGDLLCCDTCPASFHLLCCDPPLQDENIPVGEWRCQKCTYEKSQKAKKTKKNERKEEEKSPSTSLLFFEVPLKKLLGSNPTTFKLPKDWTTFDPLPGDDKAFTKGRQSRSKKKGAAQKKASGIPRRCFWCSKRDLPTNLMECRFCHETFHRDCFNPPYTDFPAKEIEWMCPLHIEHFIDDELVKDSKLSSRLAFREKFCGAIDREEVVKAFMNKISKLQFYPQASIHFVLPSDETLQVPLAIRQLYKKLLGITWGVNDALDFLRLGAAESAETNAIANINDHNLHDLVKAANAALEDERRDADVMMCEFSTIAIENERISQEKEKSSHQIQEEMEVDALSEETPKSVDVENQTSHPIAEENYAMTNENNTAEHNFLVPEILPRVSNAQRINMKWCEFIKEIKMLAKIKKGIAVLKKRIIETLSDPEQFLQVMKAVEERYVYSDLRKRVRKAVKCSANSLNRRFKRELIETRRTLVLYCKSCLRIMIKFHMPLNGFTLYRRLFTKIKYVNEDQIDLENGLSNRPRNGQIVVQPSLRGFRRQELKTDKNAIHRQPAATCVRDSTDSLSSHAVALEDHGKVIENAKQD